MSDKIVLVFLFILFVVAFVREISRRKKILWRVNLASVAFRGYCVLVDELDEWLQSGKPRHGSEFETLVAMTLCSGAMYLENSAHIKSGVGRKMVTNRFVEFEALLTKAQAMRRPRV